MSHLKDNHELPVFKYVEEAWVCDLDDIYLETQDEDDVFDSNSIKTVLKSTKCAAASTRADCAAPPRRENHTSGRGAAAARAAVLGASVAGGEAPFITHKRRAGVLKLWWRLLRPGTSRCALPPRLPASLCV